MGEDFYKVMGGGFVSLPSDNSFLVFLSSGMGFELHEDRVSDA